MVTNKKILFFVTEDWYFVSHRLSLAKAAIDAGFEVSVVTRVQFHEEEITTAGVKLIPIELSRRRVHLFKELKVVYKLIRILAYERPDIIHNVSLKPVLYGSIAALVARKPQIVNALAGLGLFFSSKSTKIKIVRPLIKILFRILLNNKKSKVILQNPDDFHLMVNGGTLKKKNVTLIRGSGVDVNKYPALPEQDGIPVVVLASRLLWDKGVGEFVQAARSLRSKGINAKFVLVGEGDIENPSAVPDSQLKMWVEEGVVEWWGRRNDMPIVMANAHIICLPSFYGEGVPKVLIEAASCGRPIVTTDAPGCREIVQDGVNGFLVPIKDAIGVAGAIEKLIESPELRKKMGKKGRELVKREFTQEKVCSETLQLYKALLR